MRFHSWLLFNLWYLGSPPWDTGIAPPELLAFIHENQPGSALDLGCGTGINMLSLARAGWRVIGVEFAWLAIAAAKKRLLKEGIKAYKIIHGNVMDVTFPDCGFDLVLDIGCFHGLSTLDKAGYIERLPGWLASGGTYLMYGHLATDKSSFGINNSDLDKFADKLSLQKKAFGSDPIESPSVWVWYKKG